MKDYNGIGFPHPAWFRLNVIANMLGVSYSFDGIEMAVKEIQRQRASQPRDSYPDVSAFGSFGDLSQHRSLTVYANKYAEQNIRELPDVWELYGRNKGCELGAIWFYDDWLESLSNYQGKDLDLKVEEDLHVDEDPEWIKFINSICKLCSQEGIDLVLFYWP